MKATFFSKPFEFQIILDQESWKQGDTISGILKSKSLDPLTPVPEVCVRLGVATLKKIRQKEFSTFQEKAAVLITPSEAGGAVSFVLDRNFPITDSTQSPFLFYGPASSSIEKLGQLQVQVQPNEMVQVFLNVLSVRFRFVLKSVKTEKSGGICAKFDAPDAKGFAALEQLLVYFSFDQDQFKIEFEFQIKKINATDIGTVAVSKVKESRSRIFNKDEYLTASLRINDDVFETEIRQALGQFK